MSLPEEFLLPPNEWVAPYQINEMELPANPLAHTMFTKPRPGGEYNIVSDTLWASSPHDGTDAPLPATWPDTDLDVREETATTAIAAEGEKINALITILQEAVSGGGDSGGEGGQGTQGTQGTQG